MIFVGEIKLNEFALTAPNLTADTPEKLLPFMVTNVPVEPVVGVKEVIRGGGKKINPERLADPPFVFIETFPDAPLPTTAVMLVEEIMLKDKAGTPPNLTAVAPVNPVPVIVTVAPEIADVGLNELIVGGGINVKPGRLAVPYGVVTLTFPLAPDPTTASICAGETTVKDVAVIPPKVTADAPERLFPRILTVTPIPAEAGVNEVTIGGPAKVNPEIEPEPIAVVTTTSPETPVPTTALITPEFTTVKEDAGTPPKVTEIAPVKFEPFIVTLVPVPAVVGLIKLMFGNPHLFLNAETVEPVKSDDIISGLLSPSKSQMLTPYGLNVRKGFGAPKLIVPTVLLF
jgi:hypothetical protein